MTHGDIFIVIKQWYGDTSPYYYSKIGTWYCGYIYLTVTAVNKTFIQHELQPLTSAPFKDPHNCNITLVTATCKCVYMCVCVCIYIYIYIYIYTHTHIYIHIYTTFLYSVGPLRPLPLRPEAHLTLQHEVKIRDPPLLRHTWGRHHVQPRMTTRPQQQTVVILNYPRPLTASNTARPPGPITANAILSVMDDLKLWLPRCVGYNKWCR